MTTETDAQIERSRAMLARMADERRGGGTGAAYARRPRARAGLGRRAKLAAVALAVIVLATFVWGMVVPIGLFGVLAAVLVMALAAGLILAAPARAPAPPSPEKLREADVKVLPARTRRWLDAQAPLLPAPASAAARRIGERLEVLSPQLAHLPEDGPEAADFRKLVGEQLPALVTDYNRVPATLRGQARGGRTPDAELVAGLELIEGEVAQLTERLAAGDLDQLQTRGRYLELKYRGDEAE